MNALVGLPDVSVVIPTYHREQQLLEAIESVRSQAGVSFEIIVVDDSPTATARSVVEGLADSRVRYIARANPSGGRPALVRNEGASHARGRYVHFLDDDDRLEPGALAAMTQALEGNADVGMVFGLITPFGDNAEVLVRQRAYFQEASRIARRIRSHRQLSACLVYSSAILVCSACMGRRAVFEAEGGFDPLVPVCEDIELWARIVWKTAFVFLDRSVIQYRTGASSLMHDLAPNDKRLSESYRRIQQKFADKVGPFRALVWKTWVRVVLRG